MIYNIDGGNVNKDLIMAVKNSLSKKRFQHSLLVAVEARKLAKIYGIDENKAYTAGLLHDIAKELSNEEIDFYINKYKIVDENLKYKNMIHAIIGCYIAKGKYKVSDDICKAIKYHNIGNLNMSILEKIIFISDNIGRNKLEPVNLKIKKVAYENLDEALKLCLLLKKEKLKLVGKELHPISQKLLNIL